jgi:hypothetical protein
MAVVVRLFQKVSHTNQHFDPASPVALSIGTVPDRLKGTNRKIDENHETVMAEITSIKDHVRDVTIWKPQIDAHQERQDNRLQLLEGT